MKKDYASAGKAGMCGSRIGRARRRLQRRHAMGASPSGTSTIVPSSETQRPKRRQRCSSPDKRKHRGACIVVTNSQNFNGTAIAKGDYIWFSSVTSFPGNNSPVKVLMRDSKIEFSDGVKTSGSTAAKMRIALGERHLKFKFIAPLRRQVRERQRSQGNVRSESPAEHRGQRLPGRHRLQGADRSAGRHPERHLVWEVLQQDWRAVDALAVGRGGLHCASAATIAGWKSSRSTTTTIRPTTPTTRERPRRFKSFVIGGATGGGGANYTGGLGPTINVTPCR